MLSSFYFLKFNNPNYKRSLKVNFFIEMINDSSCAVLDKKSLAQDLIDILSKSVSEKLFSRNSPLTVHHHFPDSRVALETD